MLIVTWNVNSLRARLTHVCDFIQAQAPDIIALQETKVVDADFPAAQFQALGYHVHYCGQKTFNGVAILSKTPATMVANALPHFEDVQKRVLCVDYQGIRIVNLYVPNGSSVNSEKYVYKLNWLQACEQFLAQTLQASAKTIVLGDFNIAPHDIDVHDPAAWAGQVLVSPAERNALQTLLALGFVDAYRSHHPTGKAYSWWDYRVNAFKRNMGLRIDHILLSHPLSQNIEKIWVETPYRALERPSDHAPVCLELKL